MKLKKALVLIFVFMVSFLAFNKEVFAKTKVGECVYKTAIPMVDTDWVIYQTKNGGVLSLWLYDNGEAVAACDLGYLEILGAPLSKAVCNDSPSSLTVYDSNEKVFYCPNKIYLNKDGSTTFSVAATHRRDGEAYFNVSDASVKMSNNKYKAKIYTPLEIGDDKTLKSCSAGGSDLLKVVNNGKFELRYTVKDSDNKDVSKRITTSIDELSKKNNVNGTSAATEIAKINAMYKTIINNYYTKIGDQNYPKYCAFLVDNNNEKTQQKLNQLNEALNHYQQIVNTSAELTKEQKKEATENATSAKKLYKNIIKSATITPYNPGTTVIDCGHLIDEDLKAVIQLVLKWVRIGAPILLIILMSVDFGQAVISQDQDAMKKATSKAIKRAVAAVALFFIPLLVSIMINWIDSSYFDKNASNCEEVIK